MFTKDKQENKWNKVQEKKTQECLQKNSENYKYLYLLFFLLFSLEKIIRTTKNMDLKSNHSSASKILYATNLIVLTDNREWLFCFLLFRNMFSLAAREFTNG